MSHLLCIESSTKLVSVALFKDESLMEEKIFPPDDKTASEKLLPAIATILKNHQVSLTQNDLLAVTAGPGSFTSLRVGMATAMGLATGINCKVVGVSSLKALALQKDGGLIAPLLNAGRGRVYAALFELTDGSIKEIIAEGSYDKNAFMLEAENISKDISFIGPGVSEADPHKPNASSIGRLVFLEKPRHLNPNDLQMRYLQEPDLGGK